MELKSNKSVEKQSKLNPVPNSKPFPKGVSGNPNGRPKKSEQEGKLEEFRSHYSNGRLKLLFDALDYRLERKDLKAVELILKYKYGLPTQSIDLEQTGNMEIIIRHATSGNSDTSSAPSTDDSQGTEQEI